MSQYVDIQVEVRSITAAVKALKAMGFTEDQIELDTKGQLELRDYKGQLRRSDLNLRIKGTNVGTSCNDFGVKIDAATGKSQVFICEFTRMHGRPGMTKFMQEYAVAAATETYAEQGKYCYRVDDKATGNVHVFVKG